MNCMKCGREYDSDMAFCPACLEEMEKYPVRPDVVVNLPHRQASLPKKAPNRKKARTPEEQIERLKRRNRRLFILLCLTLIVVALLVYLSIDVIRQLEMPQFFGGIFSVTKPTV